MTGKALATIALKVWGVVFLVGAVTSLPQILLFLHWPSGADSSHRLAVEQSAVLALSLALHAAAGLLLIVYAGRIADVTVPDTPPLVIAATGSDLTVLAFGLAGVFVLVWALQDMATFVYAIVVSPEGLGVDGLRWAWNPQHSELLRAIVEAVAGVVLLLGRSGLANAWRRLRSGTGISTVSE